MKIYNELEYKRSRKIKRRTEIENKTTHKEKKKDTLKERHCSPERGVERWRRAGYNNSSRSVLNIFFGKVCEEKGWDTVRSPL